MVVDGVVVVGVVGVVVAFVLVDGGVVVGVVDGVVASLVVE